MNNEHNNAPAVPQGAIINGHIHAERLEMGGFEDSHGHRMTMCSDWHELRRCFEHLAGFVQGAATSAPAPAQEPDDLDAMRGTLAKRGLAIVPMRITRAMADVLGEEDWQWEDLLAHAEAITEPEYNLLLSLPDILDTAPAQERCHLCDCTGDIHDATGEWRGECPYCKPAQEVGLTDERLLERLKHYPNWELSTSNDPECDPSVFWLVHEVKGGRNDREWFLIGEGDSPHAAIIAALRAKGTV